VPTTQVAAFTAAGDAAIWPAIGDSVTFAVTYRRRRRSTVLEFR
jgi:hypothetical protein